MESSQELSGDTILERVQKFQTLLHTTGRFGGTAAAQDDEGGDGFAEVQQEAQEVQAMLEGVDAHLREQEQGSDSGAEALQTATAALRDVISEIVDSEEPVAADMDSEEPVAALDDSAAAAAAAN